MLGSQPQRQGADDNAGVVASAVFVCGIIKLLRNIFPAIFETPAQAPLPDDHDARVKSCFTRALDLAEARREIDELQLSHISSDNAAQQQKYIRI